MCGRLLKGKVMRFLVNIFRVLFNKNGRKCFVKYTRALVATYKKKDYEQAISDYKFILENGGWENAENIIYKNLGIAYFYSENYDEAEVALENALKLSLKKEGHNAELYQYLGYTYSKLGKFEQALMYYEKAARFGKTGFINKSLTNLEHVNEMKQSLEKNKDLLPFMTAYFEQNKDRLSQTNK